MQNDTREAAALTTGGASADDKASTSHEENHERDPSAPAPCASCGAQESKYRCPRCDTRTCSAACYKEHKRKTSCSGQRDKTAYVAIKEFTNQNLRSDLRFLETLGRERSAAQRKRQRLEGPEAPQQPKRRGPRANEDTEDEPPQAALPKKVKFLVDAAKRRGTELLIVAPGMTRREANTSHYNQRKKEIIWRVTWRVQGQEELHDRGVTDAITVLEALHRKVPACKPHTIKLSVWGGEPVEVDANQLLREALAGQKIVEFPIFDVTERGNGAPTPSAAPIDNEQSTSSTIVDGTPGGLPSEASNAIPSEISSALPNDTSTAIPTETSDAPPTETSNAIPSETSNAIPSETSSAIPSETSNAIPSETSSALPTETPNAPPSTTSSAQVVVASSD
ncbi:Box C/D snoRNA protein 1 [Hondaea fermentalgiana]|uniref:Box C/D snoRNA protein 1 n=1 Tax=Hondaea fermentalgiana TaxID=2315210 RepID=A0A2R5GNA7_9STRA|nr:Box C/D snoRNA protein 1 [Hondaea fermentalgiana]|eukprot:GBG29354.1 Box C/D snoRNA protein 1 [Hondaea fermentalgiana]